LPKTTPPDLSITFPDYVRVRPHKVKHYVRATDALFRNDLYRFFQRCASTANFFIWSLQPFLRCCLIWLPLRYGPWVWSKCKNKKV